MMIEAGVESICFTVQLLCKKASLSGLDRLIFSLFFIWGILTVLIGGMVGGSVLTAFNFNIVSQPGAVPSPICANLLNKARQAIHMYFASPLQPLQT